MYTVWKHQGRVYPWCQYTFLYLNEDRWIVQKVCFMKRKDKELCVLSNYYWNVWNPALSDSRPINNEVSHLLPFIWNKMQCMLGNNKIK